MDRQIAILDTHIYIYIVFLHILQVLYMATCRIDMAFVYLMGHHVTHRLICVCINLHGSRLH